MADKVDYFSPYRNQWYEITSLKNSLTIDVPLIDDGVFELTERLSANLSFRTESSRVTISPATAEITILDDDGLFNAFSNRPRALRNSKFPYIEQSLLLVWL